MGLLGYYCKIPKTKIYVKDFMQSLSTGILKELFYRNELLLFRQRGNDIIMKTGFYLKEGTVGSYSRISAI